MIADLLEQLRQSELAARTPEPREKNVPFSLSCEICPRQSCDFSEVRSSLGIDLPDDLTDLWSETSGLRLFEDKMFGQWGLVVYSGEGALTKTKEVAIARPRDFRNGDLILGEFLGDSDLLVLRCDPNSPDFGAVTISTPMDRREEWHNAANSLHEFLSLFIAASGDKYWEH